MTWHFQSIFRSLLISGLLLAFPFSSFSASKSKSWQTGTLTKTEPQLPDEKKPAVPNCGLLAESIYTVDTDIYEYQFMGSLLTLLLNKSLPALKFRIRNDGTVEILDPNHKNRHFYLKLYRKYAKPGIASLRSPNLKMKRRQWVSATTTDAQPVLINFGLLVIQPAPDACMFMPIFWKYSVNAGGSSFLFLWRNGNPINITINGTSSLAIGKHGIAYLIDDNGKERKLQIRQPATKPLSSG